MEAAVVARPAITGDDRSCDPPLAVGLELVPRLSSTRFLLLYFDYFDYCLELSLLHKKSIPFST
jgi:hypothetical protein